VEEAFASSSVFSCVDVRVARAEVRRADSEVEVEDVLRSSEISRLRDAMRLFASVVGGIIG